MPYQETLLRPAQPAASPNSQQPSASPTPQQQQQRPQEEFDYKTSEVNQRGETLPAGASSWSPMGTPYFGAGLSGTMKRYAWSLMGSPSGQDDSRWERFLQLSETPAFWNDPTSPEFKQGVKELGAGVMGEKDPEGNARFKQIMEQYRTPNGVNTNAMPAEVRQEFEKLQSTYGGGSILSPIVKGTKVAVQATLDLLSEAAVKFEQGQGALQSMRDYADENSTLPGAAFEINRTTERTTQEQNEFWQNPMAALKSEEAQGMANFASRILMAPLAAWDGMRFWTAPGTLKDKTAAIEQGWNEGRVFYSQAIKPAMLNEFRRRAAAGEDPQLLAQELQNPWAEMAGQMVFDPLNVVGLFAKSNKAAGILDDATEAVRGGSLGDEATELLTDAGKGMSGPLGETAATERLTKFDDLLTRNVDRIENQRLTVDFNKATSYSPSGLRVRETKTVQTVSNVVTASIMRGGGTADDVADFFADLSKAVSTDKATRMDAWDRIMTMTNRFGMGRYAFSDDVLETGILLRNLTEDKDLLTALKAGKGDLAETAKILNGKFKAAIEKQVPTYGQVKDMAAKFEAGTDVSKQAEKAAKTYEGITGKNKALWNLHEGTVGKTRNAINETLGKFYFASFGFGVRNASGNFTHMIVDQGLTGSLKSVFRDGKFWSMGAIENDMRKWFGGNLPPAVSGLSLTEEAANKASSVFSRFSEYTESAFAKRIYWKQFRDTMDKFMAPGVALPSRNEFKALGMTDAQVDNFVHIVKNEAYGDVDKAAEIFKAKHGQPWKNWNGAVSADEMKGMSEIGLTGELDEITSTAESAEDIKKRMDALRREVTTRANTATDNPMLVNRERKGFEWTEGVGKATQEGMLDADGTNKLNVLIETSERASEELMQALGKARNTVTDPALRQQFEVMESVFSATRRGQARKVSEDLTETAWELTRQSKKSTGLQVEKLWNQSILAKRGPAPAGLTPQQFRDELWQATRGDVSNNWEMYFAEGFDRLNPLIDNLTEQFPELEGIFQKSQKASAELNMYRSATFRDGKIFHQQPPKNVRELASRYGIATATAEGTPADKQLLATINKYADQKYKSLDEVPLEEAEKALEARRSGAMTQADAARVEQPKMQETPSSASQGAPEVQATEKPLSLTRQKEIADAEAEIAKIEARRASLEKDLRFEELSNGRVKISFPDKTSRVLTAEEVSRYGSLEEFKASVLKAQQGVIDSQLAEETRRIESARSVPENVANQPENVGNIDNANQAAQPAAPTDELGAITDPTPNPEVEIQPPYVDGSVPIPGQMWKENQGGIMNALNKVETHMLEQYGVRSAEKLNAGQLKALKAMMKNSRGKITEGLAIADKIGKEWRDFALLPYGETKNLDLALSYAYPYQFWYSRSYSNWMKRVATDPQVIANYARIKETMSEINKDSPEWWRYNVEIPSHFLGLPNEHPMSFNLEANIWPLYGLTGTDFEDPQKRQNWMTSTIDDMGKLGPSVWAPVQWAVALVYRAQGEEELAQSWAGRIIPQTATFKAASSYFGQPIETDPAVWLFSGKGLMDWGAMDKYERNRVGRALTAMVQNGELTQEQAVEVARTQEGPAWDQAVRNATQIRAPGQIMSYLAGVGMKARTEEDRVTDEFYQQYYRLQNLSDAGLISPTEYQKSWDGLREQYPFADALLLSRKAGPERDRAYAYNVLGRIPPGQASELYKLVGVDPKTAQKFYDSKGDIKGWNQADRDRFMASMIDLGAMLALPDSATKSDWVDARAAYKQVQEGMKQAFGPDVQDKIDTYYGLEDKKQRESFMAANPEIGQALQWQNEQVTNNELLYQFYGGISSLEKFHKGKVFDQLEAKYGTDIQDKFDEYYQMQITDPSGAKKYYKQHPELKAYNEEKKVLMQQALHAIVEFGARLPEEEKPELTGNEPQNVSQQAVADYAQQSTPPFEYWSQEMPEVSAILADVWQSGEEIPYAVTKNLDRMASAYGYQDGESLLQAILISMNR